MLVKNTNTETFLIDTTHISTNVYVCHLIFFIYDIKTLNKQMSLLMESNNRRLWTSKMLLVRSYPRFVIVLLREKIYWLPSKRSTIVTDIIDTIVAEIIKSVEPYPGEMLRSSTT